MMWPVIAIVGVLGLFIWFRAIHRKDWTKQPKKGKSFTYRQQVKVVSGFYKGSEGIVCAECKSKYYDHKYEIYLATWCMTSTRFVWVAAEHLEAI